MLLHEILRLELQRLLLNCKTINIHWVQNYVSFVQRMAHSGEMIPGLIKHVGPLL